MDQIEKAIKELTIENQKEIIQKLQALEWFAISIDGSWENRRNANQGTYTAEAWDDKCIIFQAIRQKSLLNYKTGQVVKQGINY